MFDSIAPIQQNEGLQDSEFQNRFPDSQIIKEQVVGDPETRSAIYTMPKEYLPEAPVTPVAKGGFSWKWILGLSVVIVLVIGGAATAIVLVLRSQDSTNTNQAFALPVNNTNAAGGLTNLNGTNLNATVNGDLESNINSSLFPDNENANGNTNTASGAQAFVNRTVVPLAPDRDRDQLTDAEEVLYGTKVSLPDSDGDGFVDGSEVLKGYSPLSAQKTLGQDGLVLKYDNTSYGWSMSYPSKWIAGATDDAQRTVLFTSDAVEGEFVQVAVIDNPNGQTAKDWYLSLFSDADNTTLQDTTIAGLSGIVSPDGYAMYLADNNYILSIAYNFGTKNEVTFKTTFQMMLSTFQYDPSSASVGATQTNTSTVNSSIGTGSLNVLPNPDASTNANSATGNTNNTNTTSSINNSSSGGNSNTNNTNTAGRQTNTNTGTNNTNTVRSVQ